MNLNELIPFLKELNIKPKKGLSQNFLIDPTVVKKITQTAEVKSGDIVLEIGPGPGALTDKLLKLGAKVYAVEMDPILAQQLHRFQNGNLTVIEADILKFSLSQLPPNIKIVANLPYHITTPILEKIFLNSFSSLTIMVQKEVADRMIAVAGSKTFGSLSLFVQFYSKLHSHFIVPPNSFYPQPKIDSTVIRLDSHPTPNIDPIFFFSLTRKAFQQRRKMISSTLPFPKDGIRATLEKIGERADARPEALSLDQWVRFAQELNLMKKDE